MDGHTSVGVGSAKWMLCRSAWKQAVETRSTTKAPSPGSPVENRHTVWEVEHEPRRLTGLARRLRGRLAQLRPASIGALFAEDATYAYHPYDEGDEVVRGRQAIVADWLAERDEPGTWEASYRPLVVEGQRAVAEGTTSYANGDFSGTCGRCASTMTTDVPNSWNGS